MIQAFPNGRLLTTQFYGHGMQGPHNWKATIERYESERSRGVEPTYDDEVAKLLCMKVALKYLKYGKSSCPRDHVCSAAGPIQTWVGTTTTTSTTRPESTICSMDDAIKMNSDTMMRCTTYGPVGPCYAMVDQKMTFDRDCWSKCESLAGISPACADAYANSNVCNMEVCHRKGR